VLDPGKVTRPIVRLAAAGAAVLLLLTPALWNGFSFLFFDTGGYLARTFDGTLAAGRSVIYGLWLTAGAFGNFWPVVIAQSALTVWIVTLVLKSHRLGNKPLPLLLVVALLSVTTAVPWLAGQLMPDLFAGLSALALYLIVFRSKPFPRFERVEPANVAASRSGALMSWERVGLVGVLAFAAASHNATLAVLLILLTTFAAIRLVSRSELLRWAGLRRAGLAILLGMALVPGSNFAVTGQFAWTPGGIAFPFSRLVQDGIVQRFLVDNCRKGEKHYKLCTYLDRLPSTGDNFLWDDEVDSAFAQIGGFLDGESEMAAIAAKSVVQFPTMHIASALLATAQQFAMVKTGDGLVMWVWYTYGVIERLFPQVIASSHTALQRNGLLRFENLNLLHEPVALASQALLPFLIFFARRRHKIGDLVPLAATMSLGVLANAFVCGAFSGPHDRYGARMAWIATFVVAIAAVRLVLLVDWRALFDAPVHLLYARRRIPFRV
jgi:hypothetical protein